MVKKLFIALMVIAAGISFSASACDMSGKERALLARHQGELSQEAIEVTPEVMDIIARKLWIDRSFRQRFTNVVEDQRVNMERNRDLRSGYWNPTQSAVSSRACSLTQ